MAVDTMPYRPDRLLPAAELPAYTFVPGTSTPHPVRDPRGHSHSRKGRTSLPLVPENWADNRTYLLALDYFNAGYYWEAHEEWERLWRLAGPDCAVGKFLRGLIKLAAAGVKVLGYPFDETGLRMGLEKCLRETAHLAVGADKIPLVDEANRVRPRSLF